MSYKRIFAGALALLMSIAFSSATTIKAESIDTISKGGIDFVEVSSDELEPYTASKLDANVMERQYPGQLDSVSGGISTYIGEAAAAANTDPNNAYITANDTVMQGAIETAGEMRWYAFPLEEKSKVTILLQMVEALDSDLYMFSLNSETSQLEMIGGSAREGLGVEEYYNNVLDAGIYFFAVGGYEGTGDFAFAYYQSSADADNEINDTSELAASVTFNNSMTGVIDNPNDIDYYKVSVTNPAIMKYSITSTSGYSLLYAGKSGISAGIYSINSNTGSYKIMPGTYYFAVCSETGKYSSSSTYSVNFNKIANMTNDSTADILGISENGGITFQTNSSGSVGYVNGNPINISYSYYQNLSNSAGSQLYDIAIEPRSDVYAYVGDGVYEPEAVHYHNSTRPAMHVGGRPALLLTYYSNTNFYKIHCRGTGAYSMNTLWEDLNAVTVLIDPSTGKLIDIAEFNYYYDFAPVGSNSLLFTRSYSMDFYEDRS